MSNSLLVDFTQLSPNNSGKRKQPISRITPHCYVGQVTVERMGRGFSNPEKKAAPNYGIGFDGRVGLFVDEANRSWCSSSESNDQQSVTIEIASAETAPFMMNMVAYQKLIKLCVDICRRNGKSELIWIPAKTTALDYRPAGNEMILTIHEWFADKDCPGLWLKSRLTELADTVTASLRDNIYRVQIGAFRNKQYAFDCLEKAKKAGFADAYITIK